MVWECNPSQGERAGLIIFSVRSQRETNRAPSLFSPFYSVCVISPRDGDTHVQNKTFLLSKLACRHPPGHPAVQFLGDPKPSHVYSEDWPGQQGPLVHAWWSLTQGRLFWVRSFSPHSITLGIKKTGCRGASEPCSSCYCRGMSVSPDLSRWFLNHSLRLACSPGAFYDTNALWSGSETSTSINVSGFSEKLTFREASSWILNLGQLETILGEPVSQWEQVLHHTWSRHVTFTQVYWPESSRRKWGLLQMGLRFYISQGKRIRFLSVRFRLLRFGSKIFWMPDPERVALLGEAVEPLGGGI